MEKIEGNLSGVGTLDGGLSGRVTVGGSLRIPTHVGTAYTGPYEVTPGDEAIVLATDGTYASKDIIVNPVPSNYGKITWNGSFITVS